ncbi:hypothetical protein os4_05900 [Comamonadaceae bacterium OS-4]|nr:hypothetical protein os4_05900 [Comamonadaceae bacterium OS-4]
MTIELAPKAQPAPAKESAPQVNKKASAEGSAGTPAGSSFFAILEGMDEAPAGNLISAGTLDGVLPLVGDAVPFPSDTAGVSVDDESKGLLGDAAFLALLGVTPPAVAIATPTEGVAAKPAKLQSSEGGATLVGVLDAGAKKAPVAPTKSGRDALLAAADAASESAPGSVGNGTGAASPSLLMPPKEGMPERIQRLSHDACVSLFKSVDATPLAGAALRDRLQESGTSTRGAGSEALAPLNGLQQGVGGAMGADGVFAGSAAEAMGEQFSEDVKYWVGQDMQKAELTLDGFGHSAVEVSISLQGNEAHVAFRSDEAQTRDALSNASTQLQDALNRQGMSLAGVSVGTSNAGDSRDKAGQGQSSPWRRARVEGGSEEVVSRGIKPLNSGRNIDLFV